MQETVSCQQFPGQETVAETAETMNEASFVSLAWENLATGDKEQLAEVPAGKRAYIELKLEVRVKIRAKIK